MKIKYKVTTDFGLREKGEITDAHLLIADNDTGNGLCYHPKARGECGCLEFVKEKGNYYVADGKCGYINIFGRSVDKKFKRFLDELDKQ
jgi:hypothetical protein